MNEPIFAFTLDSPLSVRYESTTGEVLVTAPQPMSDGTQRTCGIRLTAEAAVALLETLQHLETHVEMPPSAHARPRTPQ